MGVKSRAGSNPASANLLRQITYHTKLVAFAAGLRRCCTDIIRFSHGASNPRKTYRSSFIPGLHDTCMVFAKQPQKVAMIESAEDDVLDDLFRNCALVAFVEQAISSQDWPDTRLKQDRANRLYEQAQTRKRESANG